MLAGFVVEYRAVYKLCTVTEANPVFEVDRDYIVFAVGKVRVAEQEFVPGSLIAVGKLVVGRFFVGHSVLNGGNVFDNENFPLRPIDRLNSFSSIEFDLAVNDSRSAISNERGHYAVEDNILSKLAIFDVIKAKSFSQIRFSTLLPGIERSFVRIIED